MGWWSKEAVITECFETDLHSHLLPGLDDGSKTPEETLSMLRTMRDMGFKKWITTPHIFNDYYRNNAEGIKNSLAALKNFLASKGETFDIHAAAEYYLDEHLIQLLQGDKEILTVSDRFLLFETNLFSISPFFDTMIFETGKRSLIPIMAHPERYDYLVSNKELLLSLREKGVLFQVNLLSFVDYYSVSAKKIARWMVDNDLVDSVGTDLHNPRQLLALQEIMSDRYVRKLIDRPLLNLNL